MKTLTKQLKEDWFLKDHIDFEYQQYRLLAYLQKVENEFFYTRIYPHLDVLKKLKKNIDSFMYSSKRWEKAISDYNISTEKSNELQNLLFWAQSEIYSKIKKGEEILTTVSNYTHMKVLQRGSDNKPDHGYIAIQHENGCSIYYYRYDSSKVYDKAIKIQNKELKRLSQSATEDELINIMEDLENRDDHHRFHWIYFNNEARPPLRETLLPAIKIKIYKTFYF
jgi:hypothetical protein